MKNLKIRVLPDGEWKLMSKQEFIEFCKGDIDSLDKSGPNIRVYAPDNVVYELSFDFSSALDVTARLLRAKDLSTMRRHK